MTKKLMLLVVFSQVVFSCKQAIKPNSSNAENKTENMVVRNVSVITMNTNEVIRDQDVVISNGKIISISDTQTGEYNNTMVFDGSGKYIMPSLSDSHVHLPETEEELEMNLQLYLINGVTKLRSMRGEWKHVEWRDKYNNASSIYPTLYLSPPAIGSNNELTASQAEEFVKSAKEKGFDFLKILGVKNQEVFSQLNTACKKYDLPIGGHFPSNVSDSLIFQSNYTSFEHLGGLVKSSELLEFRLSLLKEKNIFICPTLSWYSIGSGRYSYEELRSQPGMEFIPKATIDDWIEKTRRYREKIGDAAYQSEIKNELDALNAKFQIIKKAHDLGINMLLSPDSSSKYMVPGFGVLGEMKLIKNAHLSNYDILKMATINFSQFFKELNGTIETGKDADFIILTQNPLKDLNSLNKIEGVYYNSQFLDSDKIDAMRLELLEIAQN